MSKLFHIFSATLPLLAAVLVLSLSAGYFTLAWSEPSGTMPVTVAAPINTGSIAQGRSGNLGIGTTVPLAKLAVGGTGSSGDTIAAYANSGNSALYAEQQNIAGYAGYFQGKTAFMNGNVGIGTATPGAKLSFGTNYDTVGNNPTYNIRLYESGTTVYGFGVQSGTLAINANQTSGKIVFNAGTPNDVPTTRMTILGTGNVGIGTTVPGYKLDVQGGQINSSGGLCIAGDCKTAWSQVGGSGASYWTQSGSNLYAASTTWNVGIKQAAPAHELTIGDGSKGHALSFGDYTILGSAYSSGAALLGNMVMPNLGIAGYSKSTSITIAQAAIELKAGVISFATKASDANAKGTAWDMAANTKMAILNSGNVGIGTTAPSAKLAVASASSSGVTTGSSGDAIAAYANSGNSALYAEQQNSTGGGYAGYFKGDVNITRNLSVGGNINATGTINSATALCVNSVCANSTKWNTIVNGAGSGSGGSVVTNLGFTALMEGTMHNDVSEWLEKWEINGGGSNGANLDPVSGSLIISTAESTLFKNGYRGRSVLSLQKNEFGVYEIKNGNINIRNLPGYSYESRIDSYGNCAKAGSSIYCGYYSNSSQSSRIQRFGGAFGSMNKPSDITSQHTQRIILFSDGTYLYAKDLGNMLYKYEPNGLDLILKGSVAFTGDLSFSTSDGSYIYAYVSSEKKIKRYNFSGGASVKEWSVPGVKDFFFIQNNHFITGSGVYSYRGVETNPSTGTVEYSVSSLMGLNFYDLGAVD